MDEEDEFAETERLTSDRPPPSFPPQPLEVRFTGNGRDYSRIWLVNLLLVLLTLGLYLPMARARQLAYFYNNTVVGGDPLGFHAHPWAMFRGHLLVLLTVLAAAAVVWYRPDLVWALLLALAMLWPALWLAALRFRLRNTSWRGVRLDFVGDLTSAYLCCLPYFAPALALVVALPQVASADALGADASPDAVLFAAWMGVAFAVLLPWLWSRIKSFQHGGYAYAQEQTVLQAGTFPFYALFLKTVGVVALLVLGAGLWLPLSPLQLALLCGLVALAMLPYGVAEWQNLLWSHTRSRHIRFQSQLRWQSLCRHGLLSALWLVLSLGLYWPFAQVRLARLRLEAVSLWVTGDHPRWNGLPSAPAAQ